MSDCSFLRASSSHRYLTFSSRFTIINAYYSTSFSSGSCAISSRSSRRRSLTVLYYRSVTVERLRSSWFFKFLLALDCARTVETVLPSRRAYMRASSAFRKSSSFYNPPRTSSVWIFLSVVAVFCFSASSDNLLLFRSF